MADEEIGDRANEVIARDLGLTSFDFGYFIVKAGMTTMKPGMIITTFGEAAGEIDVFVDGDEYATGIVTKTKNRRISVDGTIDDGINTTFAAGDEVEVLYWTGGRAHVYMRLTGFDTAAARGTLHRGAAVYLQDFTSAAIASGNITLGSAMALVLGTLDLNAAIHALVTIGMLLEDATILDSTAAVVGITVKVAI